MSRTKRDINQIQQFEHDEDSNAKRVKMVGTELSIELDHEDGDSVTSHPAKLVASVTGVTSEDDETEIIPPLDCSSMRVIHLYPVGTGFLEVYLSPVDSGDVFYKVDLEDLKNVCARRIKVKSLGFEGDVHLVGRS